MKGKKTLRIIQILCIISLLITVGCIQKTYARYFEKKDTTYTTHIKRWLVKVNNENIHEKDELSEVMTPVLVDDENMNNNNTLVPGREGFFPILIDYSNVDLKFQFDFNFEQINATPLEDFDIYGYSIIDNGVESVTQIDDLTDITQIIDPTTDKDSQGNKTREMHILFRWNDANKDTEDSADAEGMNNQEDTQFSGVAVDGQLHELLKYNVTITFTQYIGNS